MHVFKCLVLTVLIVTIPVSGNLEACTTLIAGKNTTADGSLLFAKSEDDPGQLDYYWFIPGKKRKPGSTILETGGLQIPQVAETYAYFWDQSPKQMFSNVLINEWGVAFGSNGCGSREDPAGVLEQRGDIVDGGIGFRLRFILAERCKTAKEAVLLASELINTYGYNASGRCLNIVGPDEAWQLQMVCGKHFVARRVRDDEVVITANTFSIRQVNINDPANFICSPDIVDYAIQRGWYDPETDGEFDFAQAYASGDSHRADRNTHRAWMLARLLQNDFPLSLEDAENGEMPVSVKPDRKLSVQDLIGMFRNHFENTDLCQYVNKNLSPHYIHNKPVCNAETHKVNIIQQRNWLPVEIGTVNWRALSHPCQSVFIPWYLGINRIPEAYRMAWEDPAETGKDLLQYHFMGPDWQIGDMDVRSASSVFRLLNRIGDSRYIENHRIIREIFDAMEAELLDRQAAIERKALKLYYRDRTEAVSYLTDYTCSRAITGFEKAKRLIMDLLD